MKTFEVSAEVTHGRSRYAIWRKDTVEVQAVDHESAKVEAWKLWASRGQRPRNVATKQKAQP